MLDVGEWSKGEVFSPPCFLEIGRAAVWKTGDVLVISRRVGLRAWGSALRVEGVDLPTPKVGLGGGESVDLKLRLSREE